MDLDYMLVTKNGLYFNRNELQWINKDRDTCYYSQINIDNLKDFEVINLSSYPNRFRKTTTIRYELTQSETVIIIFYNQFGNRQQKGLNWLMWSPETFADGIYYFRLNAGKQIGSGKIALIK